MRAIFRDRRGFSTLWTAGFAAFVMVPLLMMAIGLGRYAFAAAEVQEAADLAALAAVRDVNVRHFEQTGQITFSGLVYPRAVYYANSCTSYLAERNIAIRVDAIVPDNANRTVTVRVSADVSPLFPGFLPNVVITRQGTAQVRMRASP